MDCLQLQLQPHQLRTQPFHYLINEQAKSLLALQELQNEVGALLEFRDLVMETFPNLRQKMSGSNSQSFSNQHNYCSNLPMPLSGSLNSRHWEPGIKVKRKIVNKTDNENSFGRVRSNSHGSKIQSSQPKSSEAISGVQDSGFSTETNSSNKDHASSTATSVPLTVVQSDDPFIARKENNSQKDCQRSEYDRSYEELSEDGLLLKVNEAEEELWNLLDVIHTKGTKLREEVETLQLRLMVEEIESHLRNKESEIRKVKRKFNRRCRSLDNFGEEYISPMSLNSPEIEPIQANFDLNEFSVEENVFSKKRTRSIELEDVDHIRQERNMLLEKLAEMQAENIANRLKTSELQNEISALISTKEELQEQLFQAVKQKTELNTKIHELHLKFVTGDKKWKTGGVIGKVEKVIAKDLTDPESSHSSLNRSKSSDDAHNVHLYDHDNATSNISPMRNLEALDEVMTDLKEKKKGFRLSENTKKKLLAVLKEKNYLELQRHLMVSVVQNQILSSQLETSAKSKDDLNEQLEKYKKENDELSFQLEERNIELEGTRAQVRVLEKLHHQSKNSFETKSEMKEDKSIGGGKKHSKENFAFLENDHLRSKGFSESEINRARQIFLESQNKKVDKSEVVKVLSRTKNSSPQESNDPSNSFDFEKSNNVIPILALPLPAMVSHQSSGTESTHALEISSELEADMARAEKCESLKTEKSPCKRRPSKIPLNIQKTSKSLKSSFVENSSSYLKKSDGDLNKSLKKCSLENAFQNSIAARSPSQTPQSIKYNSVGRAGSQLSITSHKSHTSSSATAGAISPSAALSGGRLEKRKSLTWSQKEENIYGSSGKNQTSKPVTNYSQARQREALTKKNQNDCVWDGISGKRTLRSSFRDSFRSKISIDGNIMRKDGSLSGGRKDSLQHKQNRTNSVQQKTNLNKSIISAEGGDNTKFDDESRCKSSDEGNETNGNDNDSDSLEVFQDSLNSPTRPVEGNSSFFNDSSTFSSSFPRFNPSDPSVSYLIDDARQKFRKKLAEKFINQEFKGRQSFTLNQAFPVENLSGECLRGTFEWEDVDFFDSIDDSSRRDADDNVENSSPPSNKSVKNEATAEFDSLEMKFN